MKINYVLRTPTIINRFGSAWLIRGANGKHALVGGSRQDYTEAKEWISLFAHDVVFSRPVKRDPQARSHLPRFNLTWSSATLPAVFTFLRKA